MSTFNPEQVVHRPEFIRGDELSIPTLCLVQQDGTPYDGAELPVLEQAKALRIYQAMVRTRVLDERMLAAQRQGWVWVMPRRLVAVER
ncbi:hypothetical protein [Aestuariirhabdus litorea]|uniref:hypothetical protein n=1 Tax=Aestuariirhabdus litorea TaxID=2528527 RepID=UPI000F623B83|nr:hypothetical protein [Aestuariirhabdus litorea]RWW97762.1 hypothetical protein DZC74_05365 [Endozoicomonadaceae bacterium GTF-13]